MYASSFVFNNVNFERCNTLEMLNIFVVIRIAWCSNINKEMIIPLVIYLQSFLNKNKNAKKEKIFASLIHYFATYLKLYTNIRWWRFSTRQCNMWWNFSHKPIVDHSNYILHRLFITTLNYTI
jgi:hypothetical protein